MFTRFSTILAEILWLLRFMCVSFSQINVKTKIPTRSKQNNSVWTFWLLDMRPLHCLETFETSYRVMRRKIAGELLRTPNILHGTIIVHVTACLHRWRFGVRACVCVCEYCSPHVLISCWCYYSMQTAMGGSYLLGTRTVAC